MVQSLLSALLTVMKHVEHPILSAVVRLPEEHNNVLECYVCQKAGFHLYFDVETKGYLCESCQPMARSAELFLVHNCGLLNPYPTTPWN